MTTIISSKRRNYLPIAMMLALTALAAAEASVARLEEIERKMFQQVNEERRRRDLPPLKWSEKLATAAGGHLAKMIDRKSLSHRLAGEAELSGRIAAAGVRFNASAENVAYATDWQDLHTGLMQSPGHRANILSLKYDQIGIAVALGPNGYYAVQNFAHVTSEANAKEAEARFAEALKMRAHRNIEVVFNPTIERAVCEMAERDLVEARRLPAEYPRQRMFAYTTSEPDEFPDSFGGDEGMKNIRRVEAGLCYRATEKYPGGTYWVGIIY